MAGRTFITVVTGLPRSGTSMMMQMLAAGGVAPLTDEARSPDDDNPRGYFEFEPVKLTKQDPSWLPRAVGRAVKMVHLLLYDLPEGYDYRVIFMRRNMDEIIASQQVMLARRRRVAVPLSPDRLATLMARQLDEVRQYARSRPRWALLEVDYNRVVADPRAQAAVVNEFLGGGLDAAAMAHAVEPGLYHQRGRGNNDGGSLQ